MIEYLIGFDVVNNWGQRWHLAPRGGDINTLVVRVNTFAE